MKHVSTALLAVLVTTSFAADNGASSLDWLAGRWCSESPKEHIDEWWMPGRNGMMLGMARTTRGDRVSSFEYMRIELGGTPTFYAQPSGTPAVPFKKTDGGASWVRFENADHDFPNRVEYKRTGNHLHAQIEGPGKDGKPLVIPYEYEICRSEPPGD